jgi:hypothetical protein
MLSLFGDLTVSITINHVGDRLHTDRRQREAVRDIDRYVREIQDIGDPLLAENAAAALWDLVLERQMQQRQHIGRQTDGLQP